MNELIFLLLFFGVPGVLGFIMAKKRGKNPLLWGLLCLILPVFVMVLKVQHRPIDRQKPPQN